MDEGVQAVLPLPEDVVGTPAHNDAGPLLRQILNDPVLDGPQKVGGGHAPHHARRSPAQKGVGKAVFPGGGLAALLDEFGIEAALQSHLLHQLLVIAGDSQPLGHGFPDGAAAAAEFPADGDDVLFHGNMPPLRFRKPNSRMDAPIIQQIHPSAPVFCVRS